MENKKENNIKSKRIEKIGPSFWAEFIALAQKYNVKANLGLGFPNLESPMFLREAAKKAIIDQDMNQYTRGVGHPRLVKALADYYSPILGRTIDPMNEIVVTVGAAEALHSITQSLLNEGDEVLLFEPFFDFFYFQSLIALATPIGIPLIPSDPKDGVSNANDWQIDFDLLEKSVSKKTKLIIVNTPMNPLGKRFNRKELIQLAQFAEKHKLFIIADEVYEHLIYDNEKQIRMAGLQVGIDVDEKDKSAIKYANENTFLVGSAGKTFSVTGWKIGWLIAPPKLAQNAILAHQFSVYCCATPLQEAIAIGFEEKQIMKDYMTNLVSLLQKQRDKIIDCLKKVPNISCVRPGGAYFILVDITNVKDPGFSDEDKGTATSSNTKDFVFCRWLARVIGVGAVPATPFYTAAHESYGENLIRLCFAKDDATIDAAVERLSTLPKYLKD